MDTPTPPDTDDSTVPLDALLARLNRALRSIAPALRRRGLWIVFGAIGGLIGGVLVAANAKAPTVPKRYYKATAVLRLVKPGTTPPGADPILWSLQEAQLTIASDPYRKAVASETGRSTKTIRNHVLGIAYLDTATVELTAVTKDREDAVQIAYHAADQLGDQIAERIGERHGSASSRQRDRIEVVDTLIAGIEEEIPSAEGARLEQLEEGVDELQQRRRRMIASGGGQDTVPPEFELVSVPDAIPINSRGYYTRWWTASHTVGVPKVGMSASLADVGSGRSDGVKATQRLLEETRLPTPTRPHPLQPISLGLLAGLVMGLSGVVLGEAWDDRIRDAAHAARATGMQPLVSIPHLTQRNIRALLNTDAEDTLRPRVEEARVRYQEAATLLATRLGLDPWHHLDAPERTPIVVVTSSAPADGKSTTTAALGRALGRLGLDVLAVDGDYHRRSLRKLLRPIPSFVDPAAPARTRTENVWYLDDPEATDRRAVSSAIAARLIQRARRLADEGVHDIVLFDAPPVLATTDAVDYLEHADAAVVVVRIDQTVSEAAQQAANLILRHGPPTPELLVVDVPTTPLDRHSNDGG